jgi:hypothetical protein
MRKEGGMLCCLPFVRSSQTSPRQAVREVRPGRIVTSHLWRQPCEKCELGANPPFREPHRDRALGGFGKAQSSGAEPTKP